MGRFGPAVQDTALELVERNFAAVVSSDAHSTQTRTTWMEDVRRLLSQDFSDAYARKLLLENPRRILKDEPIPPVKPEWF